MDLLTLGCEFVQGLDSLMDYHVLLQSFVKKKKLPFGQLLCVISMNRLNAYDRHDHDHHGRDRDHRDCPLEVLLALQTLLQS